MRGRLVTTNMLDACGSFTAAWRLWLTSQNPVASITDSCDIVPRCFLQGLGTDSSWGVPNIKRRLRNGPRAFVSDLADHLRQHVLFCREDLVVTARRFRTGPTYRRPVHPDVHPDGNHFRPGAMRAGISGVEIPRDGQTARRLLFPREHHDGSPMDDPHGRSFHRSEPDGESHLGGGTVRPAEGERGSGRGHRHAVRLVLPLPRWR